MIVDDCHEIIDEKENIDCGALSNYSRLLITQRKIAVEVVVSLLAAPAAAVTITLPSFAYHLLALSGTLLVFMLSSSSSSSYALVPYSSSVVIRTSRSGYWYACLSLPGISV